MQKQQKRRVFGQQVPWQVSVGVAFAVTVICCAKRRRHKGRRERGARTNASAANTEQGPGRRTTEDFKDLRHTGKAVAKDCHLPPLRVIVVDEAFSCTVQQLWHIICKPDPSFQSTIHRLSNNREIQYGGWHQEDGELVRKETYINPLKKNNLGPREAFCIDQQCCIHRGPSGFVLERKVYTPQVPFGGSFHNQVQWCAWMEPGSDKVRLQISCDVVFTKKWVPVKNIINSSSIEGMERFYKMWLQQLHHHLGLLNSPSHSVATRSPQGQSQTALRKRKKKGITKPAPWNTEALLSWVTVLAMLCWLVYQSYRQAQNPHGIRSSPYRMWSSNSSALPSSMVPVVHHH
ncbi:TPA: hypothetical protein ACH3X3_010606 [Trebouxia sp. C0006]